MQLCRKKCKQEKETLSKISSQDFPLIDIADDKEGGKVTDDSGRDIPLILHPYLAIESMGKFHHHLMRNSHGNQDPSTSVKKHPSAKIGGGVTFSNHALGKYAAHTSVLPGKWLESNSIFQVNNSGKR